MSVDRGWWRRRPWLVAVIFIGLLIYLLPVAVAFVAFAPILSDR